jgi:hypothetical protein
MNQPEKKTMLSLINLTLGLLVVYNAVFWASRFQYLWAGFYASVARHWKLIMFLEFLAVASIAVDIIVRFDQIEEKYRKPRFILSALLGLLFMARFILGMIELYMRGEIKY